MIDDIYHFIFPPTPQTSKEAIAVMNPKLPLPEATLSETDKTTGSNATRRIMSPITKTKDTCERFIYIKFLRVAPVVAQVDYAGNALSLTVSLVNRVLTCCKYVFFVFKDVKLHFKAFTRKDRVETLKHVVDKYMWFIGKHVNRQ